MSEEYKKSTEFIIVYFYAGAFCANHSEIKFNNLEDFNPDNWPDGSYAYEIYKQDKIKELSTGEVFLHDRDKFDGKIHYHPDSKIETLDQVRNNPKASEILARNMECNGWESIIWTRYCNWPQPFYKEKICVD